WPLKPTTKGVIATEDGDDSSGRYVKITNLRRFRVRTNSGLTTATTGVPNDAIQRYNVIISVNDFTGSVQIYENGEIVVDNTGSSSDNPIPFKMLGLGYMGSISDI